MKRRGQKIRWLPLITMMIVLDTLFLYGMPYLSGIMVVHPTAQTVLAIILFPLIALFPLTIKQMIGKQAVGIFVLNNIMIMIVSFVMLSAIGSEIQALRQQKIRMGGAIALDAGKTVTQKELLNSPFVQLRNVVFSHSVGEPYLRDTRYVSTNNGSVRKKIPVVKYCATLHSHNTIKLCQECYDPKAYTGAQICKKKLRSLDRMHRQKIIYGIVKGHPRKDATRIDVEPVSENFETYLQKQNSISDAVTPLGYLSIPLSIVLIALFG